MNRPNRSKTRLGNFFSNVSRSSGKKGGSSNPPKLQSARPSEPTMARSDSFKAVKNMTTQSLTAYNQGGRSRHIRDVAYTTYKKTSDSPLTLGQQKNQAKQLKTVMAGNEGVKFYQQSLDGSAVKSHPFAHSRFTNEHIDTLNQGSSKLTNNIGVQLEQPRMRQSQVDKRVTLNFDKHDAPKALAAIKQTILESPDSLYQAKIMGPAWQGKSVDSAVIYTNDSVMNSLMQRLADNLSRENVRMTNTAPPGMHKSSQYFGMSYSDEKISESHGGIMAMVAEKAIAGRTNPSSPITDRDIERGLRASGRNLNHPSQSA